MIPKVIICGTFQYLSKDFEYAGILLIVRTAPCYRSYRSSTNNSYYIKSIPTKGGIKSKSRSMKSTDLVEHPAGGSCIPASGAVVRTGPAAQDYGAWWLRASARLGIHLPWRPAGRRTKASHRHGTGRPLQAGGGQQPPRVCVEKKQEDYIEVVRVREGLSGSGGCTIQKRKKLRGKRKEKVIKLTSKQKNELFGVIYKKK